MTVPDPIREKVLNDRGPHLDETLHEAPEPPLKEPFRQGIDRDDTACVRVNAILPFLVVRVHHLEPRTPAHLP